MISNQAFKRCFRKGCGIAVLAIVVGLFLMPAVAVGDAGDTCYWKNDAGSGNWNADNWYNNTRGWDNHNPNYVGSQDLRFDNDNQASMINDFTDPGSNLWRVSFLPNATASRTIGGTTINTFYDYSGAKPKIENFMSATQTFNFPFQIGYSGGMEINPVAGGLTFNGTIDNGGYWIDVWGESNKAVIVNGVLSGSGGLSVKQHSLVILTNNNTFSGGIWIEKGRVRLQGHTNAMGAGMINVGTNATLELNLNSTSLRWRPDIAITLYGMGTNDAAGSLYSGSGNEWPGAITAAANAKIRAEGSALNFRGGINAGANTLYVINTAVVDMLAGEFSGSKTTGDGALRKTGPDRFMLRPGSGLTGSIFIDQGELRISTGTMAGGGEISLADGVTVSWNTAGYTITKPVNVNGSITLGRAAAGSLTLSNIVNLAGATRTLTVIATNTISGSITNGGFTKNGAGMLRISGANTYDGNTTVSVGTMIVSGSSTNSAHTVSSGATIMGAGAVGGLTVRGTVDPGNSAGTVSNLSCSALNLGAGGAYTCDMGNIAGIPGSAWDVLTVGNGSGTVTIDATSVSNFTIYPKGNPTGFDQNTSYSWTIAAAGTLSGFSADKFAVDTSLFTPAYGGTWSVSDVSGNLTLVYATAEKDDTITELISSRNPSLDGESVTFTATVTAAPPGTGTPTGTVQFKTNGVNCGSPVTLSSGISTTTVSFAVGSYTVTAVYDGDATFNGSTSSDLLQAVESEPVVRSTSIHKAGSDTVLEWPGTNSWFYTVEFTPSILPFVPWLELASYTNVHGVDGAMSATDTNVAAETKFYRIKLTR